MLVSRAARAAAARRTPTLCAAAGPSDHMLARSNKRRRFSILTCLEHGERFFGSHAATLHRRQRRVEMDFLPVRWASAPAAGSEAPCFTRADVSVLGAYNMQNDSTLHCALCLRGGGGAIQRLLSFTLLDRLTRLKLGDAA